MKKLLLLFIITLSLTSCFTDVTYSNNLFEIREKINGIWGNWSKNSDYIKFVNTDDFVIYYNEPYDYIFRVRFNPSSEEKTDTGWYAYTCSVEYHSYVIDTGGKLMDARSCRLFSAKPIAEVASGRAASHMVVHYDNKKVGIRNYDPEK